MPAQPAIRHGRHEAAEIQGRTSGGVLRPVPRRARAGASAGPTRSSRILLSLPTLLLCRIRAIGVKNVPKTGPLLLAPNHFSQMDHFFTGLYLRRQVRFMAKSQIFGPPVLTYIFKHGGVFPVRRGHHDEEAFKTAFTLLEQGEMLLIYAEGGRSRSGELGEPKAGDRPARARIRRAGGAGRDPRLGLGAALEALRLPEGDGPVRRADQLRGRDRARATSASSRSRREIFERVREMYAGLEARASFTSTQRGLRKTLSPPLTFRATWVGESRANG